MTIGGRAFGAVQGNNTVSFSGVTVSVVSWSDTQIVAVVPSTAVGNGAFQVSVNGVLSNQSSQFAISNPMVSSITPSAGGPGTQVTILGQFFGASQGVSTVSFNGQGAQIISWSNTQLVCLVPDPSNFQPGAVSVVVTVDGQRQSNAVTFTVSVPQITSINPTTDNVGATITIMGSGFGASQSLSNGSVTIGGSAASVVSWSEAAIQVKVPQVSDAAAYNVVVLAYGKQSSPLSINVSRPLITGVNPSTLEKDKSVVLSGYYFGQNAAEGPGTISLQDHGLITPTYWSDTSIQFTCPIGGYVLSTQDKVLTITVGNLKTEYTVKID